jgi:hypothetical protein
MNNHSPLRGTVQKYAQIRESEQYIERRMRYLSQGSHPRSKSPSFDNVNVDNAKPLKPKTSLMQDGS